MLKLTFSRTMEGYNHQLDVLIVGTLFNNKAELKKACQVVATHGGFEYSIIKSDHSHFSIKCSSNGYLWRMHAANISNNKNDSVFEIKTMGEDHKCLGIQYLGHCQASTAFISTEIQEKLRNHSFYCPKEIQ